MSEKSIVVFNTPNKCKDCYFNGYGWNVCIITDEDIDEYVNPNETKPEWCPLRPLPDKIEVKVEKIEDIMHTELQLTDIFSNKIMAEVKFETDKLIALGYNACLEDILGGE